ncbi:MAG: hypothetical protein U0531_21665, partial [Dehalococcoidia bacterium]
MRPFPGPAVPTPDQRSSTPAVASWQGRVVVGPWTLTGALLALAAAAITLMSRADYDFWWHLAVGRFVVEHRSLPVPDPFSFTAAGRPWVAHEWLSETAMYLAYDAAGMAGAVTLAALCMAVVPVVTLVTVRGIGARTLTAGTWTAALVAALAPYVSARPHVAAFALTALVCRLLERWALRADRTVWLLPPLFWLWGNIHASFTFGLAVAAALLAGDLLAAWLRWPHGTRLTGRDRRRLAASIGLSVVALALTPNGPALLFYPVATLRDPLRAFLGEWGPADLGDPRTWPFAALAGGYIGLVVVRRPRLPVADLVTAAAFITGALWSDRVVPFAAICLTPLIGRALARPNAGGIAMPAVAQALARWRDSRAARFGRPEPAAQAMNALVILIAATVVLASVRVYDPARDDRLPVAAVDTLGAAGLAGPLFHDYNWGGYLMWRLWPAAHVYIDGRQNDLYSRGDELRRYLDVIYLEARGDAVLDRDGINAVLFPKDTPLTRHLAQSGRWTMVYDDGQVVLLQRSLGGAIPVNNHTAGRCRGGSPCPQSHPDRAERRRRGSGRAPPAAAALARPAAADALVALAVAAVALAVRLPYVLAGDFPLNDGGLFWMMIEELRAAGYRLPDVTAYNAAGIPYVYPPFTFYLTGLLADLLRVDTLALLRILPLLASMATAPAFYRLARVMLPSRQTAVVAACAFALLPGAYVWAIMGGGLTRSFGFLFAVLALHQIHLMYTQQKVARALPVAALAALTVVSHLETAWFLAWSAAVLFAVHGRRRSGLLASALTAAGVVALTAPWWATVLARHGAGPLLAVMHTGDTAASGRFALALFRFDVTGEPLFPVLGVLALAGIGVCWRGRRLLLPYWLVALAMADNRAFQRHAAVPLALLIGVGAVTVAKALRPGGVRSPASQTAGASRGVMAATRVVAPAVALSLLLLYVAVSSVTAARGLAAALGPDDRSAMAWVAAETPA